MATLQQLADAAVAKGVPGVVALVAQGDDVDVATAGVRAPGGAPMTLDTVVRTASVTKPILGALALAIVERGVVHPADEASRWLPELADVRVLRHPSAQLDDTVPLAQPITVQHLLTSQSGIGLVGDFSAPLMAAHAEQLGQGGDARSRPEPDELLRRVGTLPLGHQPGEGWTYNTGMDVLGVLLARATRTHLPDLLDEVLLAPLGMHDTGFALRADQVARTAAGCTRDGDDVVVTDSAQAQLDDPPVFPSGAGGLLSTAPDLLRFWRMVAAGGELDGARVLSPASVRTMRSPLATAEPGNAFLDDQAWGVGGAVDVQESQPFHALGRFGWIGSWGTAAYLYPHGTIGIWLTQLEFASPEDMGIVGDVLAEVARRDAARA
ncbi:serine hydrolase domain-containing protein [Agrococcus jejuensis]|uniref:CubicO group peptidase, beta-lactamase class C family n=1 Tax=Agrococcus jejuensis TaxID=399736 RepID=A0A1G8EKN3_9MICO|nr:serine hydrolase domain-containing protein [Agrococcus jejuensis]SDH70352.1 CubicO group peptidase, beta-lactamase class C family [Agrococcus jejuensis]